LREGPAQELDHYGGLLADDLEGRFVLEGGHSATLSATHRSGVR
jgi:hypothetical protein